MRFFACLVVGITALAGCAAAASDDVASSSDAVSEKPKVEANDVSVLFPLGDGLLEPDDTGAHGALLPKELYDASGENVAGEGGTPGVARDGLRLVSMRLDPCFASLKPIEQTTDCVNHLRVVFQPLDKDAAVHALYEITRPELTDAVKQMVALRGDAELGNLGVHPRMKQEGLTGPTAKAVMAIILAHAGATNLVRFTTFSTSGLGTAWNFRGFDVMRGTAVPVDIPTLPAKTKTVAFFRGFAKDRLTGDFQPATTSSDSLALFVNAAKTKSAGKDRQTAAFESAERIEDPTAHTPNTIDCASCHAAAPLRTLVGEGALGFRSAATPGETTPKSAADISVHMFSYMGKNPSIHRRTVLETQAVAAYMSTQL